MMKRFAVPKHLPGFSLIELALVLMIIGILAGAVFKGQDVLEAAKIRAVLNDIDRIRAAAALYRDTFGQWPGNDATAAARFGDAAANGRGDGMIAGEEARQFWIHLAKAGYFPTGSAPTSKLGGHFAVEGDQTRHKNVLVLAGPEGAGLLTPKQAAALKAKAEDGGPTAGQILVTEGGGVANGACVAGDAFNFRTKTAVCILKVELP